MRPSWLLLTVVSEPFRLLPSILHPRQNLACVCPLPSYASKRYSKLVEALFKLAIQSSFSYASKRYSKLVVLRGFLRLVLTTPRRLRTCDALQKRKRRRNFTYIRTHAHTHTRTHAHTHTINTLHARTQTSPIRHHTGRGAAEKPCATATWQALRNQMFELLVSSACLEHLGEREGEREGGREGGKEGGGSRKV